MRGRLMKHLHRVAVQIERSHAHAGRSWARPDWTEPADSRAATNEAANADARRRAATALPRHRIGLAELRRIDRRVQLDVRDLDGVLAVEPRENHPVRHLDAARA